MRLPPLYTRVRHESIRRLIVAGALLGVVLVAGTVGYVIVAGWNWLDALYMTVITVTTIGYKEVHDLDNAGRVFTICIALAGVGTAAYGLSSIVSLIVSGEFTAVLRGQQMQHELSNLREHIIICGGGKTGLGALQELQASDERVVIIEKDAAVCEGLRQRGIAVLHDDATQEGVLEKARAQHAKGLITTLPNDADNVFVTLTARELAPKLVIVARAALQSHESKLVRAGANRIVRVDEVGGRHMANIMLRPEAIRFIDKLTGINNRTVGLRELDVTADCGWAGKTLAQSEIRQQMALNVVAIRRVEGELLINPGPHTTMHTGDVLIVFGDVSKADELNERFARGTAAGTE
jgi:voltage-gated potassium channel